MRADGKKERGWQEPGGEGTRWAQHRSLSDHENKVGVTALSFWGSGMKESSSCTQTTPDQGRGSLGVRAAERRETAKLSIEGKVEAPLTHPCPLSIRTPHRVQLCLLPLLLRSHPRTFFCCSPLTGNPRSLPPTVLWRFERKWE